MTKRAIWAWIFSGLVVIILIIGISGYFTAAKFLEATHLKTEKKYEGSGDLAVLDVSGVIVGSEEVLEDIEDLEDRDSVKAVLVRVNSPGGAVAPTQEIYNALLRLREKKKVYCSFGDVAASGGYYLAMACEKIFSNPGTLTGSIGVIMQFVNLKELFQWAKVEPIVMKAGKFKDVGSQNRAMTDEEKKLIQDLLDEVHNQFKAAVQKGRSLSEEQVQSYCDGRVFNGETAQKLGFVDELGGEFEAVQALAKAAGISGKPKVLRKKESRDRLDFLFSEENSTNLVLKKIFDAFGLKAPVPGAKTLRPGVPYFLPSSGLAWP